MILEKLECMAFSQSSPRNFLDIAIVYFFCFPPFIPFVGTYKLGQKEHIMIIMLARLASWCKIFFPLAVNLRKQTRMKLLYYMMDIPLPTKNDLKQEAKCIKKFLGSSQAQTGSTASMPFIFFSKVVGFGVWSIWTGEGWFVCSKICSKLKLKLFRFTEIHWFSFF